MKKYVKAAEEDSVIDKYMPLSEKYANKAPSTDLCKYLGMKEYNGIWACKDDDDILIYNPNWGADRWIRVENFKVNFRKKYQNYASLLDALRNPDADGNDIENQFNCTLECQPFASDIMIIS